MKYFDDGATRTSGGERGWGGGSFWEELNYHNTLCSNNLIIMIFKKNYIDFRNLKRKNVYLKLFQINFIKIVFVYIISD